MSRKGSAKGKNNYYESTVVKLNDNQRVFEIDCPEGYTGVGEKGSVYEFVFFTAKGNFTSDCIFIKTYISEGKRVTSVRVISPVVTAKAWSYPRYSVKLPLKYSILAAGETLTDNSKSIRDGVIKDLSGGGVKFIGREDIAADTRLRIMIEKQEGSVLAEGVVAGSRKLQVPETGYEFEIRVQFIQARGSERKKPRIECELKCRYLLLDENDQPSADNFKKKSFHGGKVTNISESGIRLFGSAGLEQGSRAYLEIEQSGSNIRAECEAVSNKYNPSTNEYEMGLRFLSIRK